MVFKGLNVFYIKQNFNEKAWNINYVAIYRKSLLIPALEKVIRKVSLNIPLHIFLLFQKRRVII